MVHAMQALSFHPAHPPQSVTAAAADLIVPRPDLAMVRFRIEGIDALVVPDFSGRGRQDDLWHTTCFELFLARNDGTYREFNFSPSGRWAAYDFSGYRAGMEEAQLAAIPEIDAQAGDRMLAVTVTLSPADLVGFARAGLSAVLEEASGHKSYWALAHEGDRPDFHAPTCFARELGAAALS